MSKITAVADNGTVVDLSRVSSEMQVSASSILVLVVADDGGSEFDVVFSKGAYYTYLQKKAEYRNQVR